MRSASEQRTLDRPRRPLAPRDRINYLGGEPSPEGKAAPLPQPRTERRIVTCLFIDIVGSTDLTVAPGALPDTARPRSAVGP